MSLLKGFKITVCAVLIAALLSGCINTVHLKDMAVVEGMGIDVNEDGVNLTVQTLNAGNSTGGEAPQGNMTVNTENSGNTISDAVSMLSESLSKNAFFGQNKLIIFSRSAAENDFDKRLDYFLRSSESRPDVAVCLSDTSAKDIIESKENDAHIPCENIVYHMKNGQGSGVSAYVTVNEVLNMYSDKTSDIYLPVLKKEKDRDYVQTNGLGLFSGSRLVCVTDDKETAGFLFISDKIENYSVELEDKELGAVSTEISSVKVKKRTEIIGGNIIFCINIETQLMIGEIENGIAAKLDREKLDKICTDAESEIKNMCAKAFFTCREYGSDSLRVGEYLAKDNPDEYERISDNWKEYYKNAGLSLNVEVRLKKLSENTQLS